MMDKKRTGKNNAFYGRRHTEETKQKISKIKKESQEYSENAGNWRGGRRLDVDGYVLIKKKNHPSSNGQGVLRNRTKNTLRLNFFY